MKNALVGMGVLVLVCVVCRPALAVTDIPHHPVVVCGAGDQYPPAVPYGAPVTYTGRYPTTAGSIPIFALRGAVEPPVSYDNPVTSWPAAGNWDFCAAFDTASCSLNALAGFSTDILTIATYFRCSTDLNGPPNPDLAVAWPLTGNGIPDGEYELGLLAAVLNNTYMLNPARTGGVTNAQVMTAFQTNFNYFKVMITRAFGNVQISTPPAPPTDLRSQIPGLMPWYPGALATIFAGYATEGDADSIAALNALLGFQDQEAVFLPGAMGLPGTTGNVGDYTTGFPSIFGLQGDADGDCFTNRQEYSFFHDQGAAVTIAAQLDPGNHPPRTLPCNTIAIKGNLSVTNNPQVTLALEWAGWTCVDVVRMRFSDDGAHWTLWEPLNTTRVYTLPGPDGYKTVRVQFLDSMNVRSPVLRDYIRLDTTAPTGGIIINNGASTTPSPTVMLGLTWSDGTGTGVTRMRFSDDGAHWTPWEPSAATRAYTLPLPNGHHTVRVQYRDGVGNVSSTYNDYINLQMP